MSTLESIDTSPFCVLCTLMPQIIPHLTFVLVGVHYYYYYYYHVQSVHSYMYIFIHNVVISSLLGSNLAISIMNLVQNILSQIGLKTR